MKGARLAERLAAPTDSASLVAFRVAFGLILVWEVIRYFAAGWVTSHFEEPEYLFTYWPFDFVKPWPGIWMKVHFGALGLAALFVALGLFYRVSALALWLLFTYVFLLDKGRYLNHFYLVSLLTFLMAVVPANRAFSLDRGIGSRTVPTWSVWLLRFQIGVPYFFGGLAKINHDWLRGEPLREWIARETDFPLIGPLFVKEPMVMTMAYGATLIDLLVPFLLLWRRTRLASFALVTWFHLMNSRMFGIGIFPWTMIATTLIFFPSDWPRRIWHDVRREEAVRIAGLLIGFFLGFMLGGWLPDEFALVPSLVAGLAGLVMGYSASFWLRGAPGGPFPAATGGLSDKPSRLGTAGMALLAGWVLVQCLLPLRHFVIPGNVHWTEEGHRFAWHMKLRDKESEAWIAYKAAPDDELIGLDLREWLTSRQIRKMSSRPDMLVQFAHHVEDTLRAQGIPDVDVRARVFASLNGRKPQLLIDPSVDLTEVPRPWIPPADWIQPLTEPLRTPPRR